MLSFVHPVFKIGVVVFGLSEPTIDIIILEYEFSSIFECERNLTFLKSLDPNNDNVYTCIVSQE